MITKDNFKDLLTNLGFSSKGDTFLKKFKDIDAYLKVDFKAEKLIYPEDKGFKINQKQTCNFKQNENFVVFECVHRLFKQGYKPEHIELEPKWKVGHGASGGRADIMIKDNSGKSLLIIECKTEGKEFDDAWKKTLINGGQLLSYVKQAGSTQFVCLYESDYLDRKVTADYRLITLKDNEKLLIELEDKKPLSFEKAKGLDVEDIFKAWKQTYAQDYATKGIFEEDIPAYEIGKTKYSLKDLNTISSNDIQGKYHEFATILRQHNVSGRENAFDKLVNLFLCKIVDETNNPEELKFYWKGIAYDDQFSLIDRLQKLYQDGMQRFLGEDVVYISADQIDKAFDFFKNDPDATKDTIKKYFKELKFFNNNDFGFIDVHNEKLFYQNTAILLKIVQMLQDIQLKTDSESASEENQFLGDMFEGFLDQGVKQSEGQFFTPMPIVKFILKSLPLESIITKGDEIPKVIDYACGAGHFLNEYAKEIKPIVEMEKEAKIADFYRNVYGIEKEYRLSKVAKVSSFMYGQDDINIVYSDALSSGKEMDDKNIKDSSFSVLVANPPYSVKGFLETLSESERKKYELIETIGEKSYPNNNSIEAFFVERAKQLLKPGGVAGIIVPSPILSKGNSKSTSKSTNVYVAFREILLRFFDIVALAEFGSNTFGKTGTNTVTLFLRRKKENPAPADHFKNRVNAWFNYDKSKDGLFEDERLLKQYCNHLELEFEDYQTLLKGEPNEKLLETDIFKEYRKEFDKWSEIKNLKKKTTFKALSSIKKDIEINKRFIAYLTGNEKEKLYYYVLASQNPQKVLIVKSPSKTTEIKEFLGYEWSAAKGNEGIKYLGDVKLEKLEGENEDEGNVALDDEDKRVLSNIFNLNNINTPLYDPNTKDNPNKINHLINENFNGNTIQITEDLQPFVTKSRLVDMIDFNNIDFSKSISTSPNRKVSFETSWDLIKLKEVAKSKGGNTFSPKHQGNTNHRDVPFYKVSDMNSPSNKIFMSEANNYVSKPILTNEIKATIFEPNTLVFPKVGMAIATNKKRLLSVDSCFDNNVMGVWTKDKKRLLPKYLYELFNSCVDLMDIASTANPPSISSSNLEEIKIPLPPPDIQQQMIDACSIIDKEAEKAEKEIEKEMAKISNIHSELYSSGLHLKSIESLSVNVQYGINNSMNTQNKGYKIFRMNEIIQGYMDDNGNMKYVDISKVEYEKYKLSKGDILFNRTNSIEHVGKTGLFNLDGEYCYASYLVRIEVNREKAIPEYVNYLMNSEQFQTYAKSQATKSINQANINASKMKAIEIPIPEKKSDQKKYVTKISACESKIKTSQDLISGIAKRKEAVIKSYLMGEIKEPELAMVAESKGEYKKK
ncbi:type-1 restriction enzyme EcoKI specificity protein [Arenibacter sp. NBRC 103722]|uniref:N-6 DNA methylase n=1 Tax=Arenibacter sp. NBRC 103722 TaxID=1113929 RepID=UPI0008537B36|nr:N-6 DNA methylase [Arenibacter sp. NBRC 103722]GBF21215.1 type-1 restriction enzyme EcoKI specificity protein [Arenibacter sp. NBRC 103722]